MLSGTVALNVRHCCRHSLKMRGDHRAKRAWRRSMDAPSQGLRNSSSSHTAYSFSNTLW